MGYKALREATELVLGECKPYSITGSLPLVGDMQDAGFDIQVRIFYKKFICMYVF